MVRPLSLLPAEHQVHDPAAANMRTVAAAVVEDVAAVAPGVLQRVRENRQHGEVAGVVHPAGEGYRRWSVTARDCPRVPVEFLAAERRKLGERWYAMEYENTFGDDIAAVFNSEDIRRAMSRELQPLFAVPSAAAKPAGVAGDLHPLFGRT
jgi:hypothetical protein